VPAYIVFSDVALREMANKYPTSEAEFSRISGVGKAKQQDYATPFVQEIAEYLKTNPRLVFEDSFSEPELVRPKRESKPRVNDTLRETLKLHHTGLAPQEIANARGLTLGTIYGHLATAIENGEPLRIGEFFSNEDQEQIKTALNQAGGDLTLARQLLGDQFEYGQLRLFRAAAQRL